MASIYDYSVPAVNGSEVKLSDYQGKVMVIVNTATGCGFTPHYKPLEIHEFCTLKYNTQFPQMKKSDVNGENALPVYGYLKSQKGFEGFGKGPMALMMGTMLKKIDKNYKENPDIKWNFTKFVVDRSGNVVARFEPTADMKKVEECVAALI